MTASVGGRFPVTLVDGRTIDLAVPRWHHRDPLYDECPAWCENAETGHTHVESCDDDRVHYGDVKQVLVRSLCGREVEFGEHPEDTFVYLETARMFLQRKVQERGATIWLGEGETNHGFSFTVDEAQQVGEALLGLVKDARE